MKYIITSATVIIALTSSCDFLKNKNDKKTVNYSQQEFTKKNISNSYIEPDIYINPIKITKIASEFDDFKNETLKVSVANMSSKTISSIEIAWFRGDMPDYSELNYMADRKSYAMKMLFPKVNLKPNYTKTFRIMLPPQGAKEIRINWVRYTDGSVE